jgi:hypothetical protein
MKLATILADGKPAVAVIDTVRACASLASSSEDMNGIIRGWTGALPFSAESTPLQDVKLLAPIPRPEAEYFLHRQETISIMLTSSHAAGSTPPQKQRLRQCLKRPSYSRKCLSV